MNQANEILRGINQAFIEEHIPVAWGNHSLTALYAATLIKWCTWLVEAAWDDGKSCWKLEAFA